MPVAVIEVFQAAKTLHGLFQLIDGGQIASSLGDIEMSAARSAFDAVPDSRDRRGQVWTCIGHLNAAQHAYEQVIRAHVYVWTGTQRWRDYDANVKRRFILILKAVCYKYLDEHILCKQSLILSEKPIVRDMQPIGSVLTTGYLFISIVGLLMFAEIAYITIKGIGRAKDKYEINAHAFGNLSNVLTKD